MHIVNSLFLRRIFPNASRFEITGSTFIASHNVSMHPSTIPTISTPGFNGIEPQTTPPQPDIPLTFSAGSDEELSSRPVESEVYARSMLPQKKGYPLWEPKPD